MSPLFRSIRPVRMAPWRLVWPALVLAACARAGSSTGQPLDRRGGVGAREQTADQQVHHVLNRLAFGARPGDVEAVRAMGVDAWMERQLHPERIDDAAVDQFLTQFQALSLTGAQLLDLYPPPAQALAQLARRGGTPTAEDSAKVRELGRRSNVALGELAASRVARAVLTERQLNEVLVDFWENHFTVFAGKDRLRYFLPEYEAAVIRPRAMGKFRDLLGAVAKSPAMLLYLDNWQSVADSGRPVLAPLDARVARRRAAVVQRVAQQRPPLAALAQRKRGLNENYARELMELHTLGVDGGYTQQDVIAVARALTGWTLERGAQGGAFVFRPQVHDAGDKVILGHPFPGGHGEDEGDRVLDLLAKHPKTAEFISTKLARRLVSDTPPPALVQRAAATFRRTDGDIREVVRTIITSPEFFATRAYRSKVKSPFELVASALRTMNATPDPTPRTSQLVNRLGQPLFGHQAPNGYPETGDAWMNTGAILNRINFGVAVASGRVPGVKLVDWTPAKSLNSLARDQQVDGVIRTVLGGDASSDTRQVLLTGTNPFLANRASGDSLAPVLGPAKPATGLAQIVGLALGAPEFQRR